MIACYRLLVARLRELGPDWNYPIHLGVTEAGDGEDGRVKSAIGIGALLCDGLGDTIRVSLTEDAPNEIPVCRELLEQIPTLTQSEAAYGQGPSFDPYVYSRRSSCEVSLHTLVPCGGIRPFAFSVMVISINDILPKYRSHRPFRWRLPWSTKGFFPWTPCKTIGISPANLSWCRLQMGRTCR